MTFMPITVLETQLKEINKRARQELEEFYDNLEDIKDEQKVRKSTRKNIQQKSKAREE